MIVGRPRYVASQPWPFPASLMLGFSAPYESGEAAIQDDELQDVRWFERAEIEAAAQRRGQGRLGNARATRAVRCGFRRAWRSPGG